MYLSSVAVRGLRASAEGELTVELPGRFSLMAGANSSGKTTVSDALYLAHRQRFPRLAPFSAHALGRIEREVEVSYTFDSDGAAEGPLGRQLQSISGRGSPGAVAAKWHKTLARNLGSIRATSLTHTEHEDSFRFVYLPAWRNPLDELARREARILVELLRAQGQNTYGSRDLSALRGRASGLLEALAKDGLINAVEERIAGHLAAMSAGVSRHWPYVRGQVIDDTYLARVLELMLAVVEGRREARPLEVSALGFVNLLHIAVTLCAIPDISGGPSEGQTSEPEGLRPSTSSTATRTHGAVAPLEDPGEPHRRQEGSGDDGAAAEAAAARLTQAQAESEAAEDSFFPDAPFHVTVVIEEPEAHLHPQLQHSLVRYLRRAVQQRPELQIVLSSHSTDVIASCRPEDLVILRRTNDGRRVCRTVAKLPLPDRDNVLRKARLHMDASRSAALFADRLVLVEGVTDAALAREFGWAWAGEDLDKQAFIDALAIVAIGWKVGQWPVHLLATRGHELCTRLAVLRDSDLPLTSTPTPAKWMTDHDQDVVGMFLSHPTLEPSITAGNEALVAAALKEAGLEVPATLDAESIHSIFRSARKATDSAPASQAGPGASKKADFALALAAQLEDARNSKTPVRIPDHFTKMFEFLYPEPPEPETPVDALSPAHEHLTTRDTASVEPVAPPADLAAVWPPVARPPIASVPELTNSPLGSTNTNDTTRPNSQTSAGPSWASGWDPPISPWSRPSPGLPPPPWRSPLRTSEPGRDAELEPHPSEDEA